ncbi:hypothetical protein GJ496_005755 [Pomphorhynchus laevis]|nr:hypothetical protein GJ496_005755 [Pomphorhynchus laevis]
MEFLSSKSWLPTNEDLLSNIETPALLLNYVQMQNNSNLMLNLSAKYNLNLRPHVKSLSNRESALLMTNGHRRRICVSTIAEAEYFAESGFDDILYAKLVDPSVLHRCAKLAKILHSFHVMVDNKDHIKILSEHPCVKKSWSVFVKLNCGTNRTGINYDSESLIHIAEMIKQQNMILAGLYVYCGDSYEISKEKRAELTKDTITKLLYAAGSLKQNGFIVPTLSMGSTPALCEPCDSLFLVNEIHPGSYIVFDEEQFNLGCCQEDDIAIAVATRVIGNYSEQGKIIIDCGFRSFTKQKHKSTETFGRVLQYPFLRLTHLYQEHGIIKSTKSDTDFSQFPIGKLLFISPWKANATALMHKQYYVICDKKVVDVWHRSTYLPQDYNRPVQSISKMNLIERCKEIAKIENKKDEKEV